LQLRPVWDSGREAGTTKQGRAARPAIENANDAGCWTSPSVADSQHCICIALAAASKVDRSLASRCMVITTHTPSYIQAFTAAAKPSPSLSLYSLAAGVRSGQLW
jgi:hypothetical protein